MELEVSAVSDHDALLPGRCCASVSRCQNNAGADMGIGMVQVPELNVQNGVLKALSFLFEYIGEMGKDYIYAVSPLLEDALMDRDLVSLAPRTHPCS